METPSRKVEALPVADFRPGDVIAADGTEYVVEYVQRVRGRSGTGWSWKLKVEGRDAVTVGYATTFNGSVTR